MNRRFVVLLLTAALLVPLVTGVVAGQANQTATSTPAPETDQAEEWDSPGPFDLEDLKENGAHPNEAQPSVREYGDPAKGQIALQYSPIVDLSGSWSWIEPTSTIQSDRIRFYAPVYNKEFIGNFSAVIVYWQSDTKRVGNTSVSYAANQTVQRVNLNFERGVNTPIVDLYSHYQGAKQVTLWLEQDGEPVEGTRWRFAHKSNPLTQAPGFEVNSKGDLWAWAGIYVMLPSIGGIFIGRRSANHMLEETVMSPNKGTGWWLGVIVLLSIVLLLAGTWQTAAILSRAPFVAGLFVATVAFVAMLGLGRESVETALISQEDLTETSNLVDDDGNAIQALHKNNKLRNIVRSSGKIYMPASGIRPFLARYWADPASVDESELKSVINTSGDTSKEYHLDPEESNAFALEPARLVFDPQLFLEVDKEPPFSEYLEELKDAETLTSAVIAFPMSVVSSIGAVGQRVNWSLVAASAIGGLAAYWAANALLGLQAVAVMAGLLPTLVAGYTAKDGILHMEMSPEHYHSADGLRKAREENYRVAKTFDELQQSLAEMDMQGFEQALDLADTGFDVYREKFDKMFGGDGDTGIEDNPKPSEAVGDD